MSARPHPSRAHRAGAASGPLAQRYCERLLHRILGHVDVPKDADQGSDGSAGIVAKDPADRGVVDTRQRQPLGSSAKSANGRTSIGAPMVRVTFEAQASAA